MHERSLMLALLKQVDHIRAEHQMLPVDEISIEVGKFSGVEAALLQSAFLEFKPAYPGAHLTIRESPVTAICQDCRQPIEMERILSLCPFCQSTKVQITAGDTLRLLHVTLKESPDGSPHR